jgi:hypothetical protein
MREIKVGAVKFKSIKAAVNAARKKNPELSYMTIYMRLRAGKPAGSAIQVKPRRYARRVPMDNQPLAV